MLFTYKAKSQTGEIVEGEINLPDKFSVSKELHTRGQTPISIERKDKSFMDRINDFFNNVFGSVDTAELIIVTKNLSGMIRAGLSLSRALSVLAKQTKNPTLNKILAELLGEINAGGTLSAGLAKFPKVFSPLFVSMVRAGEESGNMAGSLTEIGDNLQKSYSLTRKVKGAMIYPSVIMVAMLIIGTLMFIFVVPTLAKTFESLNAELPTSTKIVVNIGNAFANHTLLAITSMIGIIVGLIALFRAKFMVPYIDSMLIHMPIFGKMTQALNTARTTRTMASLLTSGVSITRAIEITEDVVQNVYYQAVLKDAKIRVEKGTAFSQVFVERPDLYPVMMAEMIQVGEETGKLSDMLMQVADFYEEEIENKTKNLSTIIEPILMVIIGTAVGFFAVSMISPLYSVLDNIK